MSQPSVSPSAKFEDAVLAVHGSPDLKVLFRTAAEAMETLFGAVDSRLILTPGAGLPGAVWKMQDGGIVETLLDARWLLGPLAARLRAQTDPCLLETASESRDPSRLPQALFPGREFHAAGAFALPSGRHDLHALIVVGGPALETALTSRAAGLFCRHFRQAFYRLLAAETESATALSLRAMVGHSCTGLVTLDWDLRPLYTNRAAIQFCGSWKSGADPAGTKGGRHRVSMPEEIFQECLRLKKAFGDQKSGGTRSDLTGVVPCFDVPGLRATIRLVQSPSGGLRRPFFQIRFERPLGAAVQASRRGGAPVDDIRSFLSPSERELLEVAAEGLSNEDIAQRLGKSLATVKSQIQSIYRKLSISNRSELIARLSGFSPAKSAR